MSLADSGWRTKFWLGFAVICAFGAGLFTGYGTARNDYHDIGARLEPPENYLGDTVHYSNLIWDTPEKHALMEYPGYRVVRIDVQEAGQIVTLVWNGKRWPPDTLKYKPMKRK